MSMAFSDKESITQGTEAGSPSDFQLALDGWRLSSSFLDGSSEDSDRASAFLTLSLFSQLSLLSSASS